MVDNAFTEFNEKYRDWFRNLWEANSDEYEFYALAKELYRDLTGKNLPFTRWDKAWQYRTVLANRLQDAEVEFVNAVIGWY
jgi:hypothetical protein